MIQSFAPPLDSGCSDVSGLGAVERCANLFHQSGPSWRESHDLAPAENRQSHITESFSSYHPDLDFDFYAGERFTYTYNFSDHSLCDIRIERIEPSSKPSPWCYGGSGRQGEDHCRYDKGDEFLAMIDVLNCVVTADESTFTSELRHLIEHYQAVRFSRKAINRQLKTLSV